MARILNQGAMATVELEKDDEGQIRAICVQHGDAEWSDCSWTAEYDDWNDATEYSTDHADRGI